MFDMAGNIGYIMPLIKTGFPEWQFRGSGHKNWI